MKKAKEYQPYGKEWFDELMKLPQSQIISMYRAVCLELQEKELYAYEQSRERTFEFLRRFFGIVKDEPSVNQAYDKYFKSKEEKKLKPNKP